MGGSRFWLRPLWTTMSSYSSWGQRGQAEGLRRLSPCWLSDFLHPPRQLGLAWKPKFPTQIPRSWFADHHVQGHLCSPTACHCLGSSAAALPQPLGSPSSAPSLCLYPDSSPLPPNLIPCPR